MEKISFSKEDNMRYRDGKMFFRSMDMKLRCLAKNEKYRLYAERFGDCNYPYTQYYIADVDSGEVFSSGECNYPHLAELREALKK